MPTVTKVVEAYLDSCEERDLDAASRFLAPGAHLEFPGGVTYATPADMARAAKGRYRWVRKRRERYLVGSSDGAATVTVVGTLFGERLDGRPFADVRFVDVFTLRHGLIVEQLVWNDLADEGITGAVVLGTAGPGGNRTPTTHSPTPQGALP